MQDLNDLYYFAQVVEHGGFAAASRATGLPKSKLSRRIAQLEERLGVRLLQRSTRRFSVTEIGQLYYRHCQALVAEADAAQEAVDRTQTEPRGTVRVSCPVMLARGPVAAVVSRFLADHPQARVHLEATNRRVDVIEEGFDIAIRVRQPPLEESHLVIKMLARNSTLLVASPHLLDRLGRPRRPEELERFDGLDMSRSGGEHVWRLTDPEGVVFKAPFQPRLVTDEMMMLRQAALEGLGLVQLPGFVVGEDIRRGRLEPVLRGWTLQEGLVHAVFPSRRGLVPAVRLFLDALAAFFKHRHDEVLLSAEDWGTPERAEAREP
ncbi:LysR substrate-binding domain-containing protein [Telmatospirillum sp. J64-1]|uniref:LysR substrate-binding domain-containing protein n=1 Tax=Telmatospirillum sp. J64-1 TaxID=2502183 RepID=UPI00115DDFEA|nr:LysR substrate-binding domain-containing protein [Telmatospirillum sp. J64-1]